MAIFFSTFVRLIAKVIALLYFSLEVRGSENIPRRGGFIVASNHASFLDPPLLAVASPRLLGFFSKAEMFRSPVSAFFLRLLGAFPLDREADALSLRVGLRILRNGKGLAIFPEGTRSRDGRMGKGKSGVAMLAVRSGCPVIPMRLIGSDRALPPGNAAPRPVKIRIIIGPPVKIEGDDYAEIAAVVMEHIRALA